MRAAPLDLYDFAAPAGCIVYFARHTPDPIAVIDWPAIVPVAAAEVAIIGLISAMCSTSCSGRSPSQGLAS